MNRSRSSGFDDGGSSVATGVKARELESQLRAEQGHVSVAQVLECVVQIGDRFLGIPRRGMDAGRGESGFGQQRGRPRRGGARAQLGGSLSRAAEVLST